MACILNRILPDNHPPQVHLEAPTRLKPRSDKLRQEHGIFTLPRELLQQIASYLPSRDAASFSLISYDMFRIIGTNGLYQFLSHKAWKSRLRENMELIENAFPSHWYCAWCDKFHKREHKSGPRAFASEKKRECVEHNSYLHIGRSRTKSEDRGDGWDTFVLTHHHVRLALQRHRWGSEYGIPLSAFKYTYEFDISSGDKYPYIPATLRTEARVVSARLYLHCSCTMYIGRRSQQSHADNDEKPLSKTLVQQLPQILIGHRSLVGGHTGLLQDLHIIEKRISANEKSQYAGGNLCFACPTEYRVHGKRVDASEVGLAHPDLWLLTIDCWRDLGDGRSPFDTAWREHGDVGAIIYSDISQCCRGCRSSSLCHGDIVKAFESSVLGGVWETYMRS